jgi:quinolinate synthase
VSAEHHASGLPAAVEAVGDPAQTTRLQEEIRSLAAERGAVILAHVRRSPRQKSILANETGMLHPLRRENTDKRLIPFRQSASCRFMKAITLPKLRDCLRGLAPQVRVEKDIAQLARIPIERMIAISMS